MVPVPSYRSGRAARTTAVLTAALTIGLAAAGCASGPQERFGADPAKVGPQTPTDAANLPTAQATAVYDPAQARGTASPPPAAPARSTDPRLAALTTQLAAAVSGNDHPPAQLKAAMSSAYGGNQLSVSWTVSVDPADTGARDRARSDARTLLGLVSHSSLNYGSVVLTIFGAVDSKYGGQSDAKVVRAKYRKALVRSTDFSRVPLEQIFRIADDKAPTILPPFR